MPKSHNKKRNVGIVYELLLRRISESLVANDKKSAQQTLDIISRRFKKGTELYKEFRLFRALAKSSVSDTTIAAAILTEAKQAARRTRTSLLEKEKSDLIREMNYSLKDSMLYRRYVPDYTMLATIQTLLNDWREGDTVDIERMALYESRVINHLASQKYIPDLEEETDSDVDALVVKIMSEKLNKKYTGRFNNDQRDLLRSYAFTTTSESTTKLDNFRKTLENIKEKSLNLLENLENKNDNKFISKKIGSVREKILVEMSGEISDKSIGRYLTLIDLCKQIEESV
tara:strand:+ start:1085 stop:1942 length:858 start_codon:yes stop_codon:yes gene_type:complete